jgi:hypothetical protein
MRKQRSWLLTPILKLRGYKLISLPCASSMSTFNAELLITISSK